VCVCVCDVMCVCVCVCVYSCCVVPSMLMSNHGDARTHTHAFHAHRTWT
jgi:hypothetical protein